MLHSVKVHNKHPATGVTWRNDGGIVTCGLDGSISLFAYEAHAEQNHEEYLRKLADAKDEKSRAAVSAPPPLLTSMRTISDAHTCGAMSVTVNGDGSRLATTGTTGELTVWDLSTYEKVASIAGSPGDIWKAKYSPNSERVYSGGFEGSFNVFDANTLEKIVSIPAATTFMNALDISKDGKRGAAADAEGGVYIIDLEAGAVQTKIDAHHLPIRSLSFSHDGRMLFTGSEDRRINVFDVSGGAGASPLVCSLHGHLNWVTGLAACPDNYVLASVSLDKTLRVWDVRKREAVHTSEGYADKLWDVAWNPAANKLAVVSDGGVLGIHKLTSII